MKKIAAEMNLPETAFLSREKEEYRLRWFTPTVEVPLCGHATLSTAHILWEKNIEPSDKTLVFNTLSGPLKANRMGRVIELNLPAADVIASPQPAGLLDALGLTSPPIFYGVKSDFPIGLLEVADENTVRRLTPNLGALKAIDLPAVIVTAQSEPGSRHDFVSRFFGPNIGIDEDPVTGAAHCALGPYWRKKLEKDRMQALQVSARQGSLAIRFENGRVLLGGEAVTIFEAQLDAAVLSAK